MQVGMQRPMALGIAGLVLAAGLTALFLWRSAPDKPPVGPPKSAPQPAKTDPQAPLLKAAPGAVEAPAGQDQTGWTEFPDGSRWPPLNGVQVAPHIEFHRQFTPFAKVVRVERDATGRDWYIHENGVRSTMYVDSLGRVQGMAERPGQAQPSIDPPVEGKK
jgi:hypothetical protein